MLLTASQATPQGPRGFSFALMSTASLGWGCDSAWASIGSVTMRYPTAAADAAATEICRKERRERQAGFSSAGTVYLQFAARTERTGCFETTTILVACVCELHAFSC